MKLKLAKNHQPQSKAWQVLKPFAQYESANGVPTVWGLGSGNFDIVFTNFLSAILIITCVYVSSLKRGLSAWPQG